MRAIIQEVVSLFYAKATRDILIGYHFEKFNDPQTLKSHLERITSFWEMQLLGKSSVPLDRSFHLLFTHLELNIKKGELGRWIMLFHQTLDEVEKKYSDSAIALMFVDWKKKIAFFEDKFKAHPQMFNRPS